MKGVGFGIEFLSFLLRKQQITIFKESQVSDGNCDLFAFVSMNHPKKIAPAEHPAGQQIMHPLNRREASMIYCPAGKIKL